MRHHSFANWPKQTTESPPADPPSIAPATDDLVPDGVPVTIAPDYSGLLKRELLEMAEDRGLDVSSRDTKAEILAALVADDG